MVDHLIAVVSAGLDLAEPRDRSALVADVLPAVPGYLEVQLEKLSAVLTRAPKRAEVPVTCEVQLVVEYYAR